MSEEKRGVGRPSKYNEDFADQAHKLCLLGATHAHLADFFNVCIDTISEWMQTYPEFSASVKKGKYAADAEIASSLYERAKGMTIVRQQAIKLTDKTPNEKTGWVTQKEHIEIVDLKDEIPPDPTSMIFWLKNRQPKEWRDRQEIEINDQTLTNTERLARIKALRAKIDDTVE